MPNLVAKTPCDGLLPLNIGACVLAELLPDRITSVARTGQSDADAFKAATGHALPSPNRSAGREGARVIWWGPGQWLLLGEMPQDFTGFSVTDQSDAWAVMRLSGADARDVLARLTPIDLRPDQFKRGHTARTLLFHMSASITRVKDDAYDIMVFRSMAGTAVHDLETAMRAVAARRAI